MKKKYRPRTDFQPLQHWKDQEYLYSNYQHIFTDDELNFYVAYKVHRPDFHPHDCQFLSTMKRGKKSWIRHNFKARELLMCEPVTPQRKYKSRLRYDWRQVDWLIASRQLHKCKGTIYDPRIWEWTDRKYQLKVEPVITSTIIPVPGGWRSPPKKEGGRFLNKSQKNSAKSAELTVESVNKTAAAQTAALKPYIPESIADFRARLDKELNPSVKPIIQLHTGPDPPEDPTQEAIDKFESKLIAELEFEDVPPQGVSSDSVPESQSEIDNFVKEMCEELEEGIYINKEIKLNDR